MSAERQRVVVLTGATRGLGRAMAHGLARQGHRVLGCGRSGADIAELRRELGGDHEFEPVDVTTDDVDRWAAELLSRHPAPDLLINNAGVINEPAALWEVSPEEFGKVLDVNLKGMHQVIRAFVPAMIARGSGVIVNFSSGWGRTTSPEVAPYCASKWGVEGLTKSLADELPAGLAAVALNPGIIDTDMLRSAWAEGAAVYPRPEAWAELAVPFLLGLGPDSNGASLTVA